MALLPVKVPHSGYVYADVDAEDLARLSDWYWYLNRKTGYVNGARKGGCRDRTYLHREVMQATAEQEVDHRSHNKLDNRKGNLRLATRSQNLQNRAGAQARNGKRSSRFRGVYLPSGGRGWAVCVAVEGRRYQKGGFPTEEAADEYARNLRAEHMPFATN